MVITIDAAGRVVIPQSLRKRLGLSAGTRITVDEVDGAVVLRPASAVDIGDGDDGLPVLRAHGDVEAMTATDVRRLVDESRERPAR